MTPEEHQRRQEHRRHSAKKALLKVIPDPLGYSEIAIDFLLDWAAAEATRIAEQIVEQRLAALEFQSSDIGGQWVDYPSFRVKPKE